MGSPRSRAGSVRDPTPLREVSLPLKKGVDNETYNPAISRHPASSTVATPNSAAFFAFDPASAPSTTRSVFFDTLSVTRAPNASARAFASGRVIVTRLPVNTTDLPDSGPVCVATSSLTLNWAARSCSTARLRSSLKNPTNSSAVA